MMAIDMIMVVLQPVIIIRLQSRLPLKMLPSYKKCGVTVLETLMMRDLVIRLLLMNQLH